MLKPSAEAGSTRYSNPVGTLSAKGPEPTGPMWPPPGRCPASGAGANTSGTGAGRSTASSGPPTIMQ